LTSAHAAWVRIWQVTPLGVVMQQAPVGGAGWQMVTEHWVPGPRQTPPAAAQPA
jgi:hypothetical protein